MLKLLFLVICLIAGISSAHAAISCPSGMILAKTDANPMGGCTCASGRPPRMVIADSDNTRSAYPSTVMGVCPSVQTLMIQPTISDNVAATRTGAIQSFIVPQTGSYVIEAWGAQGGTSTTAGGKGAWVRGEFALNAKDVLKVVVGQPGQNDPFSKSAGGGGGTFVVRIEAGSGTVTLLMAAGGGGGGGNNAGNPGKNIASPGTGNNNIASSGGGGYKGGNHQGNSGGYGLYTGDLDSSTAGYGGSRANCTSGGGDGGFGGGGAGDCGALSAGGGGGYTGGAGGGTAEGGTSYIDAAAINTASTIDVQSSGGKAVISW